MLVFWLLAALMIAVALTLVLPPLLGSGRHTGGGDERQVDGNVALYQERLATLVAEQASGELAAEAFEEARLELQRELLEDAAAATPTGTVSRAASPLVPMAR